MVVALVAAVFRKAVTDRLQCMCDQGSTRSMNSIDYEVSLF